MVSCVFFIRWKGFSLQMVWRWRVGRLGEVKSNPASCQNFLSNCSERGQAKLEVPGRGCAAKHHWGDCGANAEPRDRAWLGGTQPFVTFLLSCGAPHLDTCPASTWCGWVRCQLIAAWWPVQVLQFQCIPGTVDKYDKYLQLQLEFVVGFFCLFVLWFCFVLEVLVATLQREWVQESNLFHLNNSLSTSGHYSMGFILHSLLSKSFHHH